MPVLPNARHERFAQALAQGLTQDQSYANAGYKPNRHNASKLANTNKTIRIRVAELMSRNVVKTDAMAAITTQRLLEMAEEARSLAMAEKQPAAAVTALTAIAKLSGLWTERAELTTRSGDLSQYSDAELVAVIQAGQSDTPVKPQGGQPDKSLN